MLGAKWVKALMGVLIHQYNSQCSAKWMEIYILFVRRTVIISPGKKQALLQTAHFLSLTVGNLANWTCPTPPETSNGSCDPCGAAQWWGNWPYSKHRLLIDNHRYMHVLYMAQTEVQSMRLSRA